MTNKEIAMAKTQTSKIDTSEEEKKRFESFKAFQLGETPGASDKDLRMLYESTKGKAHDLTIKSILGVLPSVANHFLATESNLLNMFRIKIHSDHHLVQLQNAIKSWTEANPNAASAELQKMIDEFKPEKIPDDQMQKSYDDYSNTITPYIDYNIRQRSQLIAFGLTKDNFPYLYPAPPEPKESKDDTPVIEAQVEVEKPIRHEESKPKGIRAED